MKALFVFLSIACVALTFPALSRDYEIKNDLQSVGVPEWFVIEGLVENPLNLTYAELRDFPLISEVTMLQCVGAGQGSISVTYNWTGVPLFYLLNMAKVIPGNYREVIFNSTDGFSSSILLETAIHPTTILALKANGTDLEQISGFGSGYRVVLPCRWGYKWVKWVKQIIVVDYDYKGTYEQYGYSDEAIRPNCTMPPTNPPIQTFNTTTSKEYTVQALSNSSIESFSFDPNKRLIFNIAGTEETIGYFYVLFSKELLTSPYQVYVDQNPVKYSKTDVNSNVYLYFTYTHSNHTIEIVGALGPAIGFGGFGRHLLK
ncbi:MAG: molybdopterin-dependent oxidoreductase [Candidatus Bathyarchaeota archaeon]|nr:molybdopterin-dependent oxidoreductase [Candidatus Bathyarchaeota archaeon]